MIVQAKSGQDVYDIAIQYYGSLDGVRYVLQDNGLTFQSTLTVGQELTINELRVTNSDITDFFELKIQDSFNLSSGRRVKSWSGWTTNNEEWTTIGGAIGT